MISLKMCHKWEKYYHCVAAHIPYGAEKGNGKEALRSDNFLNDGDLWEILITRKMVELMKLQD